MTEGREPSFSDSSEEPEEKQEEEPGVKIRCSVFFDGTLNNRTNTGERLAASAIYRDNQTGDNSYENDLSNVARMEPFIDDAQEGFDYGLHLYVEGPGTTDLDGDSSMGFMFGMGSTGVKEKVNRSLDDVISQVRSIGLEYGTKIDELVIDAFGFSRGAAGARYFVHKANNNKPTGRGRSRRMARPLDRRLRAVGFKIQNENVKVGFVGLYDTVASEGAKHTDDRESLKLNSVGKFDVEKVIQLAAAHEYRKNFSLNDISSTRVKHNGEEIFLPGAHSDIGGGYRDGSSEDFVLYKSYSKAAVEADMRDLIEAGWYRDNEIWIDSPPELPPLVGPMGVAPPPPQKHKLRVRRDKISNEYSKIALHIMAEFARKSKIKIKSKLERRESIPPALSAVHSDLKTYAQRGGSKVGDWDRNSGYAWLASLHHDFLHFSSHYTLSKGVYAAMQPKLVNGKRVRRTLEG